MHHVLRFIRRLLNVVRPHRRDEDLARELSAHLTLLEDECRRRGLPPDEARRQARATIGGVERIKELHRDARSFVMVHDVVRDARYAVRLLRRAPVFAATATLSLAIAIGATTTVFTAVNALLMQTAPGVTEPDRLVDISRMADRVGVEAINHEQYVAIRERATLVGDVFAYALNLTPMSWVNTPTDGAQAVFADRVTPNFFTALGVTPAVGRMFTERDTAPVVVLSDRFWHERLQRDPAVVGSAMRLGDQTFTVIGVARREFHGNTILAPDVWIPADSSGPIDTGLVSARLKRGITLSQARAEMAGIGRDLPGAPLSARQQAFFAQLRVDRSSPVPYGVRILVEGFFALLMAVVSLVLIVACANVSGLLLARAASRSKETAVRVALGVSQARLVRQLLTETVVLFAAGGAAGLLLSRGMTVAILRLLPSLPLPFEPSFVQDDRVVAFALGLSFAGAVAFGLAPAIQATRVDVLSLLKAQEQGSGATIRLRRAFVVAQVALSLVLVIVGGLLTRALARTASVNRGFDAHGVDVISIDLATAGYTASTGRTFISDLERKLRSMPDTDAVALASGTPSTGAMGFQVEVPGAVASDNGSPFEVLGNTITRGYFATLRIPMVAGRDFAETDKDGAVRSVIVSQAAVRRFWPSLAPHEVVGRQLLLQPYVLRGSPGRPLSLIPMTIVGIASDVLNGATTRPYIYLPIQQQYEAAIKILVRTHAGRRGIPPVRELLFAMDRRLPVLAAEALEDQAGPAAIQLRISAAIAGSLGIVGALLAAIGVYGVTAYMVSRRTREIGIRVALGADRGAVIRMAIGEAVRTLATGGVLGLLLAAAAARVLGSRLQFGIVAVDPVAFAGTLTLFVLVGLAASYMPVRRALAIDPSRALRYE